MISERRLAAARANGAKSRGPVTARGKAISACNSRRHGLRSQTDFADPASDDQWIAERASLREEFQPQSEIESTLVDAMASAYCRLLRIWKLETTLFDRETHRQALLHPAEARVHRLSAIGLAIRALTHHSRALELIMRHEARAERLYYRALARLTGLRHENRFVNERTRQLTENTQPASSPPHAPPRSQTDGPRYMDSARQTSVQVQASGVFRSPVFQAPIAAS